MSAVIDIQDLWVEARSSGGSFQPIVEGVSVSVYPGEVVRSLANPGPERPQPHCRPWRTASLGAVL